MALIVRGAEVVDAWRNGAQALLQAPGHAFSNLITEVDNPTAFDPLWYGRFDPKSVGADDRLVPSGTRLEFGGAISGNMRLSFQAARSIG